VSAGAVTTVSIPIAAEVQSSDVVEAKGIHVTAADEVTVYGLSKGNSTTDAFLGLPADVLGTEHIVLGYRNGSSPVLGSQLGIVATVDDTQVTVVPSATTGSHPAGEAYVVTMDAGETYQLRNESPSGDLSGTLVTSDEPVAVFGGHRCASITPGLQFCDHLVEQLPPVSGWGTSFATMPLATRNGDTFRFVASEDDTEVTVNGSPVTLDRGQVVEQVVTGPAAIEATRPILVAQYANSSQFDGATGDPFMMLVPSSAQHLTEYTLSTPATGFAANFVNVVAPEAAVGAITLDGTVIPPASFTAIGASGLSGAQVPVAVGPHRLAGPLPFGVHAYGFAAFESYGYPGGAAYPPAPVVLTVALTPESGTNVVGEPHCVTATVTDQNGTAVAEIGVDFTVTGANPTSGAASTGITGQAAFCYTGQAAGNDVITAAAGSATDTATKTWTEVPRADTLVLTPKTATNVVDSEHCVTATVDDQFGQPFPGAQVVFTVLGPNPGGETVATGGEGTAKFCYTGTTVGTDTITAAVGQIQDTATKDWTPEPPRPTTLTLDPPTATNVVNTPHCVTATLLDQRSSPMQGVAVAFTVSGTHSPPAGSDATDPGGKARFCYTGMTPGPDVIEAAVGALKATAEKIWTPEPAHAATLTLAPKTATNVVGTQHCVTATVRDQRGNLFPGADVLFAVTGAHTTGDTVATGANGEARFCYPGTAAGEDVVTASVGEIRDTAAKTWTQPSVKRVFLVLDEDGRRKGKPLASKPGDKLTLGTGQTGDEGWFAPTCIPRKWLGGSGDDCLEGQERDTAIDNVSGLNGAAAVPRGSRLDKVPAVMPLRALGLSMLVGKEVCAVSSSSDLSVNYDSSSFPFTSANLQGTARGLLAFRVEAVVTGRGSSSSLPQVTVTVLDPAGCGDWELYNAPVPRSSSEPEDMRPDRPAGVGGKGYLQARVWLSKGLFF
jgi:hypothetical protein